MLVTEETYRQYLLSYVDTWKHGKHEKTWTIFTLVVIICSNYWQYLLSSPNPVPNPSPKSRSQIQVPNPKSQIQSPEERDWDTIILSHPKLS